MHESCKLNGTGIKYRTQNPLRRIYNVATRGSIPLVVALIPTLWVGFAAAESVDGSDASAPCLNPDYKHGHAYVHELKYKSDFKHFEFANPDAPKGGTLRLAELGTYDSFNHIPDKGRKVTGMDLGGVRALTYDRLLEGPHDEFASVYGRLAEGVHVEPDYSWIAFKLRNNAYWHDGEPITVEDVIFTFESYLEIGSVGLKTALYHLDKVVQIGENEVCFITKSNVEVTPSLPFTFGGIGIMPKHYWEAEGNDLSKTLTEPPLGSGPYRVKSFNFARSIVYERVDDYWGADIPALKGRYNYDQIRFDYYGDEHVMVEALKADNLDFRNESVSKNWTIKYNTPEVASGIFKRELIYINRTWGMWWPVFWNLRVERFQDIRVREALFQLYDFPWINRVILHGFYNYGDSYFYNSDMAWEGLPSEQELELLEPLRGQIPERVFTTEFTRPPSSGFGSNRETIKRALELFAEAGWEVIDGELTNVETGEQFTIDFVLVSPMLLRAVSPFGKRLEQVGIEVNMLAPEVSHYQFRMQSRSFDGGGFLYIPSNLPGIDLRNRFGSITADQENSPNFGGIKDPAVDTLIEKVVQATNTEDLLAATRALDRVLLWNFYQIPGMGQPGYRAVYWNRFGRVEDQVLSTVPVVDSWWYDAEKDAALTQGLLDLRAGRTVSLE